MTEEPNIEEKGDDPVSIFKNCYILIVLITLKQHFLYILHHTLFFSSLSKAEYCIDDSN